MLPIRLFPVLFFLAGLMLAGPAIAQTSPNQRPAALDAVVACRTVTAAEARLACYDAAVAGLDSAERQGEVIVVDRDQVSAARRQLFGFDLPSMPSLFERGERAPSIDAIETTLVRASQVGNDMWVFTLGDGSIWRQVNMESTRFSPRPGQAVRVRRAAIGSYLMTIGNGRAVRVRRVNP